MESFCRLFHLCVYFFQLNYQRGGNIEVPSRPAKSLFLSVTKVKFAFLSGTLTVFFALQLLLLHVAQAQMGISSFSAVTQDFNGIGSSGTAVLPAGFKVNRSSDFSTGNSATTRAAGTSGTGILTSSSGGGTYNFANGVSAVSTDRAIGFLTSGSFLSPQSLMLEVSNQTGKVIGSLSIAFDYEKYRSGSRAFDWTFFTSTDGSTWTAQPNGNQSYAADANNTSVYNPPLSLSKTVQVTGLEIQPNEKYYFRWTLAGSGGSTNGQAIGVDNISVTATELVAFSAVVSDGICPATAPVVTLDGPGATGYKYDISLGSSYTGSMSAAAGGTVISSDPLIISSFPAPPAAAGTSYTLRVINATGQFKDTTVTVRGIPDNCIPTCAAAPAVAIATAGNCIKGAASLVISYVVQNGTAFLSSNGAGVLTSNSLAAGSGSVTYSIHDTDRGKNIRFIAAIADPDNGGPCVADNDTIYIAIPPANAVFGNIEVCEGGSTLLRVFGPGVPNTFTWDFEGMITGQGISQNPVLAGNAPVQTTGSGISVSFQGAGAGCSGAISSTNYSVTSNSLLSAIAAGEYFEFCAGPAAGNSRFIEVTALQWSHRASGTGPMQFALVSADNPTVVLLTGTVTTTCTPAGGTIPANPSTCYRIYYWSATNAAGTLRVDNLVLTAKYKSPSGNYNFYTADPSLSVVMPAATGASYDPAPTPGTTSNIWVTALGESGCNSDTVLVTAKVNPIPVLNIAQPMGVCSPNTLQLSSVNLGATPVQGMVSYHSTSEDAEAGMNALTGAQLVLSGTKDIYVRYLASGCYTTGVINAVFYPAPSLDLSGSLAACSGESTLVEVPNASTAMVTFTWDFEMGISGPGVSQNRAVVSDAPVQTVGTGINASPQNAGAGCSNAISANNFAPESNNLATAIAANDYFSFCLGTTEPGFLLQGVTAITWSNRASNTGPVNYALVASDNPTVPLLTGTVAPGGSCEIEGGTLPALNSSTCYRLYYWAGPATSSTGTLRIDNFAVTAQYVGNLSYKFYAVDPAVNLSAVPVSTASVFDPGTTQASSPDTLWVTGTNMTTGCASPASQIVVNVRDCDARISDPCICAGSPKEVKDGKVIRKGVFSEIVEVTAPTGQIWRVLMVSGLFKDALLKTLVQVGDTLKEALAGSGKYLLGGFHEEEKGYALSASNGSTTLTIDNYCYYPSPTLSDVPALLSPSFTPFTVEGGELNHAAGLDSFFINNVAVSAGTAPGSVEVRPAMLTSGTNSLRYIFDAQSPSDKSLADPGCVTVAERSLTVASCGCASPTVTLNPATCTYVLSAADVATGFCTNAIVRVMDSNPLNKDTIDCAGTFTYGLFDSQGALICWGRVTAEDKSGPALIGVRGRCNATTKVNVPNPRTALRPFQVDSVSQIWKDTFLCMDVDKVYNVANSWRSSTYAWYAGEAQFRDACDEHGSCDCRNDVKVTDQLTYYPCTDVRTNQIWAKITRVFTATDCRGNETKVTQEIYFVRPPVKTLKQELALGNGSQGSLYGRPLMSYVKVGTDGKLEVTLDSVNCTAPTEQVMIDTFLQRYYIFNDSLNCDDNLRNDYSYFAESVRAGRSARLLECSYSFDVQQTASYPVCEGNGRKVEVVTNYFDWCTGVKLSLDTILLKYYDNTRPELVNNAKEQVVISTGALDCTASFGIDTASLRQFFGIVAQDNAGGCGIRDVSVKVESCVDSVSHGIIVAGRAWRSPEYQTVLNGSRRMVLGVPVGMHRLIIDATDLCYSQKRDTFYFRVEDKIAPVVKCTDQLNVTLSNTMGGAYGQSFTQVGTGIYGYARVLASQINAGTSDNCGLDWVRVRRALPADTSALGLRSYYESLKNDFRYKDEDGSGSITKGDFYDWNGNNNPDGFEELFHDTLLPVGSSTLTKVPFIMTPLLDWVDFFCSDYDQNVMIELWAKDVTRTITTCAGQGGAPAATAGVFPGTMTSGGNMNYCWMNVLIEDKVAPTFIRPWDVTAVCLDRAWLDTMAIALSVGTLQLEVDNLTGTITSRTTGSNHAALYNYIESQILSKTANNASVTSYISGVSGKNNVANNKFTRLSGGDCGRIRLDVVVSRPNWHCDAGQYRLTYRPQKLVKEVWQTYDGPASWPNTLLGGGNVTTITIEPVHAYDLRFPADVTGNCSNLRDTANVVDGGELGCDVLAVLVQDKRYNGATKDGAPVAECYKIFRTFTVVNWCQYDERCLEPMGDAVIVPRTATGGPVTVTVRDANRDKVEEYTYNGVAYTPARASGSTSPSCAGSTTAPTDYKGRNNGPEFYSWIYTQYIFVHDSIPPVLSSVPPAGGWVGYQNKETCGGEIEIKFDAFDVCAGTEVEQDAAGLSLERVFLNRSGNKNNRVAVPISAISPLPPSLSGDAKTNRDTQTWIYRVTNANTAAMKAHSQELVPGKHSLTIVVRDDCGNLSRELDIPFEILDTVVQAPICITGLTTQLTANPGGKGVSLGSVAVWATDFIASPIYDCNGQGPETDLSGKKLIRKYYIIKDNGDGVWDAADSLDAKGLPLVKRSGVTFNCSDALFSYVKIRIFSEDEKGNMAYCDGYVIITDAQDICGSGPASVVVSGVIATEKGLGVEQVEVNLSGMATMIYMSERSGKYSFSGLEPGNDYTVTPHLDKDPMNGVSTYDLAMITRHVLSQQLMESPYQLIAADINNSRSITTLDIIQLRKLILGVESKFISNTSWRFIDAAFRFPNPQNPWQTNFPELVNVNDLSGDINASFVAVKIGDVSGNANVAALARSSRNLSLRIEDQPMIKGSEYRIPVFGNLNAIGGMQFTLEYDQNAVELVDVEYGVMKPAHLGIFQETGVITASWNPDMPVASGEPAVFTMVVRSKQDIPSLQGLFGLTNRVTRTEAYSEGGSPLGIALEIDGAPKSASLFELKQNIPNPVSGETLIGFKLPVAGEVTLTLSDVQGKIVKVVRGEFGAGDQQIRLNARDLPAGVLQYTLSCGAFTSTRRMLVVK